MRLLLRKRRILRKPIGDVKPRRLAGNKYMEFRFYTGIDIERAKWQTVLRRIVIETAEQRRPADAAEPAMSTGRRFVKGHKLFTPYPAEVGGIHHRIDLECGDISVRGA